MTTQQAHGRIGHKKAGQRHPQAERSRARRPELSKPADRAVLQRAVAHPHRMQPEGVQALQRAYGNRAVTRLLRQPSDRPASQTQAVVPAPGTRNKPQPISRKIEPSVSVPIWGFLYPTYYGLLSSLKQDVEAYNQWDQETRVKIAEKTIGSTENLETSVHSGMKKLDTVEHRAYEWFGRNNPTSGDRKAKQVLAVLNQVQKEHKYWTRVIVNNGLDVWTAKEEGTEVKEKQLQEVWNDILSEHEVFDFANQTLISSGWVDVDEETMDQFRMEMHSMLARLLSRSSGRRLLISLYQNGLKSGKKLTFGPRSAEDIPGYRANVGAGTPSFLATESQGKAQVSKGQGAGADVVVAPGIRESSFADKDKSGRPIVSPSFVGLGHELIHALHYMTGTWWSRVSIPKDHPAAEKLNKDYGGDLEEFLTIASAKEIRDLLGGTRLTIDVGGQPKPVEADDLLNLMQGMPTEASIRKEHGLEKRWGHESTASPWEYGQSATEKSPDQVVKDSVKWWEEQLNRKVK